MAGNKLSAQSLDLSLTFFSGELSKRNISYFVFFGTLLGLIRDGQPIAGDDDVDFYVDISHYDKVCSLLANLGFHINFEDWPNNTRYFLQASGLLHGDIVRVDFYFYEVSLCGNYLVEKWNFSGQPNNSDRVLKVPKPLVFPLTSIEYQGLKIPMPKYPEIICEFLYGPKWRIPQQKGLDYTITVIGGRPIRTRDKNGKQVLLT